MDFTANEPINYPASRISEETNKGGFNRATTREQGFEEDGDLANNKKSSRTASARQVTGDRESLKAGNIRTLRNRVGGDQGFHQETTKARNKVGMKKPSRVPIRIHQDTIWGQQDRIHDLSQPARYPCTPI